jgi:hypothetical protein
MPSSYPKQVETLEEVMGRIERKGRARSPAKTSQKSSTLLVGGLAALATLFMATAGFFIFKDKIFGNNPSQAYQPTAAISQLLESSPTLQPAYNTPPS